LLVGLASFVIVMSIVIRLTLRLGVLDSVVAVGGVGGLDFPLLFSFQTLVLLLFLLVAGCAFVVGFRTHTSQGPLLYLICLSLVSAPAAFSRVDVGHIIINTLGALIAALVVLSQYRAIWRFTWPAFAIVLLLSSYGKFVFYHDLIRQSLRAVAFNPEAQSPAVEKAYITYFELTHKNARAQIEGFRASQSGDTNTNAPRLPLQSRLLVP